MTDRTVRDRYIKTRSEQEANQMKQYTKQQDEITHIKKFIASVGQYFTLPLAVLTWCPGRYIRQFGPSSQVSTEDSRQDGGRRFD